jgi:hypothetical protein
MTLLPVQQFGAPDYRRGAGFGKNQFSVLAMHRRTTALTVISGVRKHWGMVVRREEACDRF